jgi:hypothetical protein
VYSQVVEKVVPFPEKHLAVAKVALKDLNMSLSSWVFVFKDPELPCGGNLLFNLDGCKVKVGSTQN